MSMPGPEREPPRPLRVRLAWFVALWLAGVGAVTAAAFVLRLWIAPH
jgi:hypothetical protein